jgi:protein-S-isoprenylcysteine O-methyltransferase Ste14
MQQRSTSALLHRALKATLFFCGALWLLIFVSAGSLGYWQGWLFFLHFTAWTLALTLYFVKYDPALVERRMHAGPTAEHEPAQKRIQLLAVIVICSVFLVSAIDFRFGWSAVPTSFVVAGHVLVAAGYAIIFVVFQENSFAASIVVVSADQKVISTGPYALVRHPMYSGAILMFPGIPLALGSWWGLVPAVLLLPVLVARLQDEEAVLVRDLPGYEAYRAAVGYRLVPGVW